MGSLLKMTPGTARVLTLATDEPLKKLTMAEPVSWAFALSLRVGSHGILRETEQKIFLSFSEVHKMPVCCKGFSNAELYFITGKHQRHPQGLAHWKIVCGKGTLITS